MDTERNADLMAICACRITSIYGHWARLHGLSYNSFIVLNALSTLAPCTQKDICEGYLLPKQTVNTVVKSLFEKELISLSSGRDKKEKLISLTEKGREYSQNILSQMYEAEKKSLLSMGEERADTLALDMVKFVNSLQEEAEKYE